MAAAQKFYVVWQGRQLGVFDNWSACADSVRGFSQARYKSYGSRAEADRAFAMGAEGSTAPAEWIAAATMQPLVPSYAVDASCRGNPGVMEYRGVDTATGDEIFHAGPYAQGTNNIGEFLAIVHALAWCAKAGDQSPIYSDSLNALAWVSQRRAKTRLLRSPVNTGVFALIARAENWLKNHKYDNPLLHWQTKAWGEIPADFGRK